MECKDIAVKLLTFKDRTEKELRDKLKEKGCGEKEIDETLELLKSYGYIDDVGYAKKYIADAVTLRGHGPSRIRLELVRKGISRETVDEALENAELNPREQIEKVLAKRYAMADLGNPKERNRIIGYFARRGYSYGDVISAINERCAFEDIDTEV